MDIIKVCHKDTYFKHLGHQGGLMKEFSNILCNLCKGFFSSIFPSFFFLDGIEISPLFVDTICCNLHYLPVHDKMAKKRIEEAN